MASVYKGFSTENFKKRRSFKLNDIELVKRDLLNHIFTRRGERIMMSGYGTRIPDLIFEQLTPEIVEIVEIDLLDVFDQDPRVEVFDLIVVPLFDQNTIVAVADLDYIELNLRDRFDINIRFEE